MSIEITIPAKWANVTANTRKREVGIDIEMEAEVGDILGDIPVEEVINHYSDESIMEKIGKERFIEYFDIEEK